MNYTYLVNGLGPKAENYAFECGLGPAQRILVYLLPSATEVVI